MKRGIIRIVAGVILLVLQALSIIGLSSTDSYVTPNLGFYIGFYSPTIIGITLLIFGSRAYRNQIYSKLILHSNNQKIHTAIKWVGFTSSAILFVFYLVFFIVGRFNFNIITIANLLGMLAFSVYSLFYMYKKPSCLFSTALIFIGVAYIYEIISKSSYYILYLSQKDYYVPYVFTGILPRLIAGTLYIVAATIVYKETFSVKSIRNLGWIIFALEILSRVVSNIVMLQSIDFADPLVLTDFLFVIVVMLYMSVLKVNSLRDSPKPIVESNHYFAQRTEQSFDATPAPNTGWRCSCGRPHPRYETSCVCGKSKFDSIPHVQSEESETETTNKILFCRKCGSKLLDDSLFCSRCGTEVIKS